MVMERTVAQKQKKVMTVMMHIVPVHSQVLVSESVDLELGEDELVQRFMVKLRDIVNMKTEI